MASTNALTDEARFFQDFHNRYWFLFLPNLIPLLELTITRFPNVIDLTLPLSITAPLYLVVGLVDYSLVLAVARIIELSVLNPSIDITTYILFCGLVFRVWRFGLGDFCRRWQVNWMKWADVRKLNHLLLLINPALFWHTVMVIIAGVDGPQRFRSSFVSILWMLLTGEVGDSKFKFENTKDPVLKALPTLVLLLLAGPAVMWSAITRRVSQIHPRIPILDWRGWSELAKADAFVARMRDEALRRTLVALRAIPSAISARLPWEQGQATSGTANSKRIRLLRLCPAVEGLYDIRGYLEEIELADDFHELSGKYAYTAVSYCWGDPTPVRSIFIDDKRVQVSESAYRMLLGLRPLWRSKRFWIDQICIKQDDAKDKEDQIPLMTRIYKKSSRLVIWLGDASDGPVAVAAVNRLWVWNRIAPTIGWDLSASLPSAKARRAMLGLIRKPWFTRTWIVQEVTLGSDISWGDKATIVHGGARLSWKRFAYFAMSVLRQHNLVDDLTRGNEAEADVCLLVSQHVTTMALLGWFHSRASLLFCLVRMFRVGRFDATVNKDRVYAVLSLCNQVQNKSFKPDYAQSDVDLLTKVALHCLDTAPPCKTLEFLGHSGLAYGSSMPGLPSWVPDWTVKATATTPWIELAGTAEMVVGNNLGIGWNAAQIHSYGEFSQTHYQARPRFKAAREILDAKSAALEAILDTGVVSPVPDIETLPGGKLLTVSGRYIDRVQSLSCGMSSGVYTAQAPSYESLPRGKVLVRWLYLARSIIYNNAYGETGSFPDSFLRAICTDLAFDWTDVVDTRMPERPLTDDSLAMLRWYLHEIETESLRSGSAFTGDDVVEGHAPDLKPSQVELLDRLKRVILLTCVGRMFGLTERRCFGLFLCGTQPGDLICSLDGCPVLMCLRPCKSEDGASTLKVVGPCYVQGVSGTDLILGGRREQFVLS